MRSRSASREQATPVAQRLLEVGDDLSPASWWGRVCAFVLLLVWGFSVSFGKMTEPPALLHLTVILFHEAGHVLFMPFGEVLRVAGGTFAQLLMPLLCAVSFARRGDNFAAALCAAWLAMSLMDASVYAYDAAAPVLPLIGGGTGADSFHDFIFLFEHFGQLEHARGWALLMKALGMIVLLAALLWAALLLYLQREAMASR